MRMANNKTTTPEVKDPGLLSCYSDGLRAGGQGFEFRQRQQIFLYSIISRPALGPTQHPVQFGKEGTFSGVKRPGREADNSRLSSSEVKNVGVMYSLPTRLQGIVFNQLFTGTTKPYPK
jgi:hypothetical protein